MLVLHLLAGNWLTALEDRAGDWVWAAAAEHTEERRLVVVDIDERSLAELGPWPWPRATQAQLIQQLAQAGARQQVLDVVFTNERPDDGILARAIAQHRPVLAQVFALEQGGTPSVGQLAGAFDWPTCPAPFGQARGYLANTATLLPAGPSAGVPAGPRASAAAA
ncbi:MAG: CHASE2 domain-containing protein, partial [Burkholderiaceae bacterium]|nr:CHASE2 domain-containing protein [Burkholderiaceae bacterium]